MKLIITTILKFILQNLIYFIAIITFAQQTFIDKVTTSLQKNQLFFEKTFIHTNKTSYYANDNIWFKAYVGGLNNKPSLKTTLLYVCLLDKSGEIIQHKNVLINKGIGKGQFEINDSLKTDKYYIQAYTNNMLNFGKKNFFIQEINILNEKRKSEPSDKKKYDIQLFPEGGYLLEGIKNNIGIKSLINGMSYDYSGTIINSKNQEVASFKNEYLGMTKCNFFYTKKEKYKALININDTILIIDIPLAKSKGVLLNLTNKKRIIDIQIKTNNESLTDLKMNKYHLLFHQRNKITNFLEIDSLNIDLEIEKKYFFNGVNSATLFKNNKPILERKFYVEKEDEEVSISLKELSTEKDSINYQLKILNTNSKKSLKSNISISVLNISTLNSNETTNIKSAFLLTPYIKGYIEKPAYYFNKKNLKRKEHLDLLMLTQGWTKYSIEEMVEDLNPTYKYDFEIGFKLKGTVSPQLSSHLALISKDNQLIDKLFLNGNKNFSFNELLIYKGDTVNLSFLNNKNIVIKPKKISFDTIKTKPPIKFIPPKSVALKSEKELLYNKWLPFYYSDSEILEEVIVLGKRRRSEEYYKKKALNKKYRKLVFDIGAYYNIELPKESNYSLMSFLAFEEGVRLVNWRGIENYLATGANKEAVLFIDGKKQKSDDLPATLEMEDVENIMVQPIKGSKLIQVFTTENYKKNITNLFKEYVFNEGYDKIKKYYAPVYDFNKKNKAQIEIDWKPDLITNNFGEVEFKIKTNSNYLFLIQGITKNGALISNIIEKI
jgi:hypothetical protein